MTDRKIITRDKNWTLDSEIPWWFDGGVFDFQDWWIHLPDAPKHTDEEYGQLICRIMEQLRSLPKHTDEEFDILQYHLKNCNDNHLASRREWERERAGLDNRIKELESSKPKHTDEEYEELKLEWHRLNKIAVGYEARIKELETNKAPTKPGVYILEDWGAWVKADALLGKEAK